MKGSPSPGGTGVVTGSPPNLVVPEILNKVALPPSNLSSMIKTHFSSFSELWSPHGIDVRLLDGVCNPSHASQPRPCMALASKASGSFPS